MRLISTIIIELIIRKQLNTCDSPFFTEHCSLFLIA